MGISVTNLIRKAWGYAAGGSYITTPIPDTTASPGRASFEQGSPPLSMTAKIAGGIPPFGQDYNGILNMITNNLAGLNAGQINVYDATFASDIGGYAKGAIIGMADGTGFWINLTAGNTTDPDASGAGWAPMYRYDWSPISGLVGGTRTLTQIEARSRVIVLTGVLGSNQSVIFPTDLREWLVINSTTGAFTLTCKTASGTGVVVPNGGGSNATQIYGDGTNIYFAANPTTIPVDQAATPLTIVERTSTGAIVADDLITPTYNAGVYTPTLTAGLRASSLSLAGASFIRIRNIVTVSLNFNARMTGNGGGTMYISLPVASNFTGSGDLNGSVSWNYQGLVTLWGAQIFADTVGKRAQINWDTNDTSTVRPMGATFQYVVK